LIFYQNLKLWKMKQFTKSILKKFWILPKWMSLSKAFVQIGKPVKNYLLYRKKIKLRKQKNRAKKAYLWYSKVSTIIGRIGFSKNVHHEELLNTAEMCLLHFQKQFPDYTEEQLQLEDLLLCKRIQLKSNQIF